VIIVEEEKFGVKKNTQTKLVQTVLKQTFPALFFYLGIYSFFSPIFHLPPFFFFRKRRGPHSKYQRYSTSKYIFKEPDAFGLLFPQSSPELSTKKSDITKSVMSIKNVITTKQPDGKNGTFLQPSRLNARSVSAEELEWALFLYFLSRQKPRSKQPTLIKNETT